MVWDGQSAALVWADQGIYFQKLDRGGEPLMDPVHISDSVRSNSHPVVDWNGQYFFVVWEADQPENQVLLALVSDDGQVVTTDVALSAGTGDELLYPSLAWPEGNAVASWLNVTTGAVEMVFIAPDGLPASSVVALQPAARSTRRPTAVSLGDVVAIVWDAEVATDERIRLVLIDPGDGTTGAAMTVQSGVTSADSPSVAFDGETLWCAFTALEPPDAEESFLVPLTSDGIARDQTRQLSSAAGTAEEIDITYDTAADRLGVVWNQGEDDAYRLFLAAFDPSGNFSVHNISPGVVDADDAALVGTGDGFLIVHEGNEPESGLYVVRVDG